MTIPKSASNLSFTIKISLPVLIPRRMSAELLWFPILKKKKYISTYVHTTAELGKY